MSASDVEGLDRLERTLNDAADALDNLTSVNRSASAVVVNAAQRLAPQRTGTLARSIYVASLEGGVHLSARAAYAGVIHWGWPAHSIKAQPFLRDAVHQNETQIVGLYADEVEAIVNSVKGE